MRQLVIFLVLSIAVLGGSCSGDLSDDFQDLSSVNTEGVDFINIANADAEGVVVIYGKNAVAQQITPGKKYLVHEAWVTLSRVGTFDDEDSILVSFCNDDGGDPNSSAKSLAYDVKLNDIPEAKDVIVFVYNQKPTVQAGTPYWIKVAMKDNTTGDENNYIKFYYNTGNPYDGGVLKQYYDGGSGYVWSEPADDGDLGLQVWGVEQQ